MYFVVSAGGTAGHINPALAVADELRSRGHDILFVGTPDHIEAKLAVEAGFEFVGLEVSGFDKAHPMTLVSSSAKVMRATKQVKRLFEKRRPDAVVTFGAYVTLPVGRAAAAMGIPLVIHEQNSVPGMANGYLAKHATVTAVTYGESAKDLPSRTDPLVVGNPVRASFETSSRERGRALFGIPDDATVMLVFGGSLGAQHLNHAICAMKEQLLGIEGLYIVQGTGAKDHAAVLEELSLDAEQQRRWHVVDYISEMGDVLAASDFVISRSGASSVAEIVALGVPALFVPYPHARGNHQMLNAASCVNAGAARLVEDAAVEGEEFARMVLELATDGQLRATMAAAARKLAGQNARLRLADIVEKVCEGD